MIDQEFFCAVTHQFGTESAAMPKLPTNRPTVRVDAVLPGIDRGTIEATILEAFNGEGGWAGACDLRLDKHLNPKTTPTLIVIAHRFDGNGKVLADQQLPFGAPPWTMRLDSTDAVLRANLLAVTRHELGHFIGLSHFPAGGPPELMEPALSSITTVQPTEAALVAKVYGEPKADAPNVAPKASIEVVIDGQVWVAAGTLRRSK